MKMNNQNTINDLHIKQITPLISPHALKTKYPSTEETDTLVFESRRTIKKILKREDPRLLAVVGPCSIHDRNAALEYAEKLKKLSLEVSDQFFLVMRIYFEKPRTTVGWRGMILDPDMDGSYDIEKGIEIARRLLKDISELGVPAGSEMLDPIIPQYISDFLSWAAIGARTTESQVHRNLASGLSMPVGFKNSTSGNLQLAVNAMKTAYQQASFIGIDQSGGTAVFRTTGNDACHIILRGGDNGPNYYEEDVEEAVRLMNDAGMYSALVVDCSHANSGKKFTRQRRVFRSVVDQILYGQMNVAGVMLESNLLEGNQKIPADLSQLTYGVSITDACIGWKETETLLRGAAESLRKRRSGGVEE